MFEYLMKLCELSGASGDESGIADYIKSEIGQFCECSIDPCGNLIAFKKGKERSPKKVMLDAHMDEVGFIINSVDDSGFLGFSPLGGINTESLVGKRVNIKGVFGVIQVKPIHLLKKDETDKMPDKAALTIDIGAKDKEDALKYVSLGDIGTFDSEYVMFGDGYIKAKALDDRVGCAILMQLAKEDLPFDVWFSFSVQEELGLRGAKVSAYSINPDYAISVECTTAADIAAMPETKTVCCLGDGAVIPFMDNATLYCTDIYDAALKTAEEFKIKAQTKRAVAGGNNSGAIHLSRNGVKTLNISVPCRYLHSPSCVIKKSDAEAALALTRAMYLKMAADKL